MGEYYTEQLVEQRATFKTLLKKVGIVVFVIMMFMVCIFISLAAFPLFLASIALAVFLWRRSNLEFEYLYYSGGYLDIDKIMGKQKRKRIFSTNIKEIEIIAPTGAHELHQYRDLKTYDCSTNSGNKSYEMVLTKKGQKVKVIFEPKEEILKNMRLYDMRKIFL